MHVVEQPSTQSVLPLFFDLSPVSQGELDVLGFSAGDVQGIYEAMRDRCEVFALFDKKRPIALFWYDAQQVKPATYFLSATGCFDRYLPATRAIRRFLDGHPRRDLVVTTLSPHPMADRWLKAIGLRRVPTSGPGRRFVLSG